MKQPRTWLLLAGAALMLAACGGGGYTDPAPAQEDPLSGLPREATQTVNAWVGYLDRLTKAAGADSREGFEVSSTGVTSVPGDDAAEPMAVMP